jgi:ribosomal-protein-alanine N-acetyltransferase
MPESPQTAPESFQTLRLLLRKPREADAPLIFAGYARDPEVVRYLMFRPHRELRESEEAVQRFIDNWEGGRAFNWLIFQRDSRQLIGAISARREQGIAVGYCLARPFWGQGYMSEALAGVVEWAFTDPAVFRIWAVCDLENENSARLLERNGFQREGILRKWSIHPNVSSTPRDCYCYARTREE